MTPAALDLDAPWWSLPLLVLDFETTGVNPAECMPVSVGAIRYEQGEERGTFYSLLDPGIPIPPGASEIHGITDAMVSGGPSVLDVAPQLAELAAAAVPCAFNARYDRTILHRFVVGQYVPLFDPAVRWVDPLVMLRKIDRYASGSGRHKLSVAATRWDVPLSEADAHNALCDCRAAGGLMRALIKAGKLNPRTRLGRLLDYQNMSSAAQDADREKYLAKCRARDAQQSLPLADTSAFGDGDTVTSAGGDAASSAASAPGCAQAPAAEALSPERW